MSELSDSQRVAKGHRAQRELTETNEAFDKVRTKIVEKLLATSIDQQGLREKLFLAAQTVDAVKRALNDVVQDGAIIEVALAQQNLLKP